MSKQSLLACEIAIQMAVDDSSYRTSSKSLGRIFGSQAASHEGIGQNLIRASKDAKLLLKRSRKDKTPKEKPEGLSTLSRTLAREHLLNAHSYTGLAIPLG